VEGSVPNITPGAEPPALSDEDRAERLQRLAERLCSADGLDRHALSELEASTDSDQHGPR